MRVIALPYSLVEGPYMKKITLLAVLLFSSLQAADELPAKDKSSGLIMGKNWQFVQAHCTACHSTAIITQNHMSRESWQETIRWMQKKQGLWPLGDSEKPLVDYLAKYYGAQLSGRRKNLPAHLLPTKNP